VSTAALWDVIVVGAGPAGATTSALLARRGFRVLVLEKDHFPRFHIGESLLPAALLVQTDLGVPLDSGEYLFKRGAQFVCEKTNRVAAFDFAEALPGPARHAYHVERSVFDLRLRDRAIELGAVIRHGVKVNGVEIEDSGVRVQTTGGEERGRFFVDATGQDRLLGRLSRSIEPFQHFGKAASFVHYEGIGADAQAEFLPHNDIRVMMVQDGWAWVIPLTGGRLSVGRVSRKQGLSRGDVLDYVAGSPALSRWTQGARASEPRLIGNFSFRNTKAAGARFACVGDSAAFIDPVFSSGVSLAILGGYSLVDKLAPALENGTESDPLLTADTARRMQPAYDTFASLVYRFYNTRFVENFMFGAPEDGELRPGVTSVLAGDVLREDNAFRNMLLTGREQPWRKSAVVVSEEETVARFELGEMV